MALIYCMWGRACQTLFQKLVAYLLHHMARDIEGYVEQSLVNGLGGHDPIQSFLGEARNRSVWMLGPNEGGSDHRSLSQALYDTAYQLVVPLIANMLLVTGRRWFM